MAAAATERVPTGWCRLTVVLAVLTLVGSETSAHCEGPLCASTNTTTPTTPSPPAPASNVTSSTPPSVASTGRALNMTTAAQHDNMAGHLNMTQLLQDLSLDDVEDTPLSTTTTSTAPPSTSTTSTASGVNASTTSTPGECVDGGERRAEGNRWHRGCDESCLCRGGRALCTPRCARPAARRGLNVDPLCTERPTEDECCAVLVCDAAVDSAADKPGAQQEGPGPVGEKAAAGGLCRYKNQTYRPGEAVSDGCAAVCTCMDGGTLACKPRCPPVNGTAPDRCLSLPDERDPCCTKLVCDVTLGDHEVGRPADDHSANTLHLLTAEVLEGGRVRLRLAGGGGAAPPHNLTVEASDDGASWRRQEADGLEVCGLQTSGKPLYLRVSAGPGSVSNAVEVLLPLPTGAPSDSCTYKQKNYTVGEEFHDGCDAYCACTPSGVQCANIECPTDFGLDVLDPQCVTWENVPADFVPSPPSCCPEQVRCKDNGSCPFAGRTFDNWAEIPVSVSGCERRCYCEYGKVSCQPACPPLPATPPADLDCPPGRATLARLPGDDCCKYWLCPPGAPGFPPPPGRFPGGPGGPPQPDEVTVQTLEPLDEHTIRLVFSVPPVLVGLHGRIELRYSADGKNSNEESWEQQVLAPPDDLIATQQLEFELGGLLPDTLYRIRIRVLLRDLHNSPASPTLSVRTPAAPAPSSTLPPQIEVDAGLSLGQVNTTWAALAWRKFTDNEMQFIDGVQLRYKEVGGKVYAATPLIHRAVTSYTLEGLKPDASYEVAIFFIPFPGQATELRDERVVQIHTAQVQDIYAFTVEVVVHHIKSTSVEISWSGVPYPEDKYVNIFRAIYQSESGKEDLNTFKVAKRETQPKAMITDLKPGTRYRLWLEVYLTNGRIKKSNVQDFNTKPGSDVAATQQGKLEHAEPTLEAGNYYGPLVAVAILAALAIVAALILLLILIRKYGQNKATISAHPRPAHQAAYDNPSYKVEIQQETMDL